MKNNLLKVVSAIIIILSPIINFAQAPDLGTASTFALFTSVGAFDNVGASHITGDIGTNVGAFTGFPPGNVIGQIQVATTASAQAATDVDVAYSYLSEMTCGIVIGTTLGSGQVLTPNVYCLGAASTLNGDLVLDGQGDANALFIFKIDGALSTSTFSNIVLINGATLCNVFWQVNGQFTLGDSSVFRGTLLVNGAISLLEASSLYGRGLSRAGKIAPHNNIVDVAGNCAVACTLKLKLSVTNPLCNNGTDGKITTTVSGGSGHYAYLWSNGSTASSIENALKGSYSVRVTDSVTGCVAEGRAKIQPPAKLKVTAVATPISNNETCDATVQLTATGGTAPYTYTWSDGYVGAYRDNLCMAAYRVTVTDANGCQTVVKGVIHCLDRNVALNSSDESNVSSGVHVTASPNPSKGQVNVSLNASKEEVASIMLADASGKLMLTDKINLKTGNNFKLYNWSSLARGMYFLHVKTGTRSEVVKVILN
ncbi:MAG: ice-binding family protein [Panacibacter sp.]